MTWHEKCSSRASTSSDSDSDDSSATTTSSTSSQENLSRRPVQENVRERALVSIQRRSHAQRLAARRITQARAVLRAKFLLGQDMSYAKLVVHENEALRETNKQLIDKDEGL